MSARNRVAHLTGLNHPVLFDGTPGGLRYRADGSPGILAGKLEGFTLCYSYRWKARVSSTGLSTPFVGEPTTLVLEPVYRVQNSITNFYFGNKPGNPGYLVAGGPSGLGTVIGQGGAGVDYFGTGDSNYGIVVQTYVADDAPYGGGGDPRVTTYYNQLLIDTQIPGLPYELSGVDFELGGLSDLAAIGSVNSKGLLFDEISAIWVTPGIPTYQELVAFYRRSMQEGYVIPAPWRPAITNVNPNPQVPDAPTGAYFLAADCNVDQGAGAIWTDRISGIELTLEGTNNDGNARLVSSQPWYYTNAQPAVQ